MKYFIVNWISILFVLQFIISKLSTGIQSSIQKLSIKFAFISETKEKLRIVISEL